MNTNSEDNGLRQYLLKAEEGDANAQFQLGLLYEDGKATKQDIQECINWYQKAANTHPQAAYNLASIYYLGRVVAPDYKIAFKYYNKAAELGNEQGMFQLGLIYLFGQGVTQDFDKCKQYFEKASDKGSIPAMNNLGNMYRSGIGMEPNLDKAQHYYKLAAIQNDYCAMTNLATLLLTVKPVEAFDWYYKAAQGGFVNAQYNLGVLYEEGTGTKQNLKEALYWYKQAANQGSVEGKEAVLKLQPLLIEPKKHKPGCECLIF